MPPTIPRSRSAIRWRWNSLPLKEVGQICLDANFRYRLAMPSGKVALGLQFVGLESSAVGRQMLLVLGQVSAEYLRRGHFSGRSDAPQAGQDLRPPVGCAE